MESLCNIPEELLAATRACVLAVGIRRTTLTEVARRAGVSRMTVYRSVPDLNALVLAMITEEFAGVLRRAEAEVAERASARGRLAGAAGGVVAALVAAPLFRRVLEHEPELFVPYLTTRFGSTQRLAHGHLRRLIQEGLRDGSIAGCDPDRRAWELVIVLTATTLGAPMLARESGVAGSSGRAAADLGRDVEDLVDRWLAPATDSSRVRREPAAPTAPRHPGRRAVGERHRAPTRAGSR
jgi:AcrR family transcriptional regulator